MIRVLHIIKSLGRGGAEMLLQETLQHHNHNKFEFHYIYFLPWKDQMVAGIQKNGGIVTNLPAKNNIVIMLQVQKILKYIRKHDIQLVHCHLPWAGFLGRLIYKMSDVPVLYSEHNKQERYHKLTKTINKATFNSQTAAIAVSADVAESIQKNIRPSLPVKTILNGVAVEKFIRDTEAGKRIRDEYGISREAVVIGTIAVFRFQKRLIEWIDVFKETEQKFPGIRGIIVGDGILKPEIMNHIRAIGMENKIVMPGLQTEVMPWLSAMDIFMMTSVFEGLPIALLEAMSMECAIVSTDAGGIKEVIRNEEDGFMVPVERCDQLIHPLSRLIESPQLIKSFGSKARDRVNNAFSLSTMVKQTEELYESVIVNKQ